MAVAVSNVSPGRRVTGSEASRPIVCPTAEHGIGSVITNPESPQLIAGVVAEAAALWPDDRGYFLEVARMGKGLAGRMNPAEAQVSAALSYPGTIKAFHYHQLQADYWTVAAGMLQVALVDLREESPTFGLRNTLYLGTLRPWRLWIPPGVGHGYKVIGEQPAVLVYLTSRQYDPADEGRIPYDDPGIAYDWELQHK
ncbi:MAG: dTDP-4-dehydrorhamnose 3,5-epimerase [Acidobacteria bacterium]|nr:dTDP-4-dehydrorhamnose 3,5-epimerase [Acidobacteriota bacterium]